MTEDSVAESTQRAVRGGKTKTALLTAGRKLFADHPVDAIAIDDIVTEAKVAKGSFYNHFEDKEALLAEVVKQIRANIESHIATVNAAVDDPVARIVRAICVYVASVVADPGQGRILLRNDPRVSARLPLNEGLRTDMVAALHRGRLVLPSIEIGLLFVIGTAHSVLLSAVRQGDMASAQRNTQQLCMLMLRAFSLPPAEAELISAQAADEIICQPEPRL